MKICIGILAHNESQQIAHTLNDLMKQTIFTSPDWVNQCTIEITVVPNGCSDDTAVIAEKTLEEHVHQQDYPHVHWQIHSLDSPGKCNAWNVYVHNLSAPAARYLILMDADIRFVEPATLASMITILEENPTKWVSVDLPLKDIYFKKTHSFMERLSLWVTPTPKDKTLHIAGSLYCGRSEQLRKIHFPTILQADDDFLTRMIRSNGFTELESPLEHRIIRAEGACHTFEAYTKPEQLLRHERWLVMSLTVNMWLIRFLQRNCHSGLHAGTLIARLNQEDPLWLNRILQEEKAKGGWWLLPSWMLTRRFLYHRSLRKLLRLPVTVAASLVDLYIFMQANLELHRGRFLHYPAKS